MNVPARAIDAAILGGGEARRMGGVAKGLLVLGGETVLARQVRALGPPVRERLLVVGGPSTAEREAAARLGLRLICDRRPGAGPLAGLEAALLSSTCDALVAVAGDLPFLSPRLIALLCRRVSEAEAVVPRVLGRPQPLCAVYRKSALGKIEVRLDAGALRVTDLLDALDTLYLDESELKDADPGLESFINLNTPADLEAARARTESPPPR